MRILNKACTDCRIHRETSGNLHKLFHHIQLNTVSKQTNTPTYLIGSVCHGGFDTGSDIYSTSLSYWPREYAR